MKGIILTAVLALGLVNGYAISIDEVMRTISVNNTEIKSADADIQSQKQQLSSSNNLNDPEVEVEYLFGEKSLGDKWQVGVSQSFDWPGAYGARNNANVRFADALDYSYKMKKLDVLIKAKLLCVELVNLNKNIVSQQKLLDNITSLYNEYKKGFDHGEISILDVNKLKLEMFNIEQDFKTIESQKQSVLAQIIGLNANNDIEGLDVLDLYSSEGLEPIDVYIDAVKAYDPECGYYAALDKANADKLKAAKMDGWPKMSLGYKYSNELGEKFNGFTVGLSIPIFSNRNKVKAAKAESIAYQFGADNAMVQKEALIKSKYARAVELAAQINAYKNILGDDSNIVMLRKALDGGQITLLNYLLEMRYFIEAQKSLISFDYEYHTILCELDKYSLLQ